MSVPEGESAVLFVELYQIDAETEITWYVKKLKNVLYRVSWKNTLSECIVDAIRLLVSKSSQ